MKLGISAGSNSWHKRGVPGSGSHLLLVLSTEISLGRQWYQPTSASGLLGFSRQDGWRVAGWAEEACSLEQVGGKQKTHLLPLLFVAGEKPLAAYSYFFSLPTAINASWNQGGIWSSIAFVNLFTPPLCGRRCHHSCIWAILSRQQATRILALLWAQANRVEDGQAPGAGGKGMHTKLMSRELFSWIGCLAGKWGSF